MCRSLRVEKLSTLILKTHKKVCQGLSVCSLIMVEPLQVLRKAWNPSGFCYPLILSYSEWINNSRIYFLELSKYLGQKLFFTDSNRKIALLKYIKPYVRSRYYLPPGEYFHLYGWKNAVSRHTAVFTANQNTD